jgi:hypothetical protein
MSEQTTIITENTTFQNTQDLQFEFDETISESSNELTPKPSNNIKQYKCLICSYIFDSTYPACPQCNWD